MAYKIERMMEPDRGLVRLPRVHRSDGAFVTGELPAIVIETAPLDFHAFYVGSRDRIGRALALTLHDSDLAADAVDEAMVRAYQRWNRVSTLDNPSGWVYRVGLNYGRSRLRRSLRGPPPGPDRQEFAIDDPAIARALDELSLDHRAVIVCRLLLGWSESDTAAALRIRPGTAKSRLHRALAQLQSKLHHLRPEDPR